MAQVSEKPITLTPKSEVLFEAESGPGVYYVPTNSFRYEQAPVPVHEFEPERRQALNPETPTSAIDLDLSHSMGLAYPATTPNLLGRYIVIRPGEEFSTKLRAASEIYYVIRGSGTSVSGGKRIAWNADDVFLFPGGQTTQHVASSSGALLFLATDEPMLSFSGLESPPAARALVKPTHYPTASIEHYLGYAYSRPADADETSKTVVFTTRDTQDSGTTTPWITTNLNTLRAGGDQRPHRHNSAALTLSLQGEDVYSMVDGQRVDWRPAGVLVTPPQALHSHHNRGRQRMRSFVVQDSGIFYYSRAVGFSFDS